MKVHCGILDGYPVWDKDQAGVLVNTPGIPREWVYHCLGLGSHRRRQLRKLIGAREFLEFGKLNAASVAGDDGFRMLLAVPVTYRGPIPVYSKLWLQQSPLSARELGAKIGVSGSKVWRWRNNHFFDPATLERISREKSYTAQNLK